MQRNRNDQIRTDPSERLCGENSPCFADRFRDWLAIRLFHFENHVPQQAFIGTKSNGTVKRERFLSAQNATVREIDKWPNRAAASRTGSMGIGENLRPARPAKIILLRRQRLPAGETHAGQNQLPKPERQGSDKRRLHRSSPGEGLNIVTLPSYAEGASECNNSAGFTAKFQK